MIYRCRPEDRDRIYFIVNEAARAYEGVIPPDRYHRPYMPMEELEREMSRMTFFGWEIDGEAVGAVGAGSRQLRPAKAAREYVPRLASRAEATTGTTLHPTQFASTFTPVNRERQETIPSALVRCSLH